MHQGPRGVIVGVVSLYGGAVHHVSTLPSAAWFFISGAQRTELLWSVQLLVAHYTVCEVMSQLAVEHCLCRMGLSVWCHRDGVPH